MERSTTGTQTTTSKKQLAREHPKSSSAHSGVGG